MGIQTLAGLIEKTRCERKERSPRWTRDYVAKKATVLSIDMYGEDGPEFTEDWIFNVTYRSRYYKDEDLRKLVVMAKLFGLPDETIARQLLR